MRQAMPRSRRGRFGGLRAALERLDRLPPRRALLLGAGVGVGGGVLLWTPGGAVGLAGAALLLCGGAALLATAEPLADVAVAPEDPLPMEELPGGLFLMGSDEFADEQPVHEVTLARVLHDHRDPAKVSVGEVMARPLPQLDVGTHLDEAYRLLLSGNTGVLATQNGEVVGIVTRIDLIDYWTRQRESGDMA